MITRKHFLGYVKAIKRDVIKLEEKSLRSYKEYYNIIAFCHEIFDSLEKLINKQITKKPKNILDKAVSRGNFRIRTYK